ncbi:MAG: cobalamin-dependent protein [Bacteroidetes bacterium]|nr:cobalamin-dependent protein [Bacteroidales bacterium]MBU1010018.1 cobalamin-dependent protein [Bacteroidota bacterium]
MEFMNEKEKFEAQGADYKPFLDALLSGNQMKCSQLTDEFLQHEPDVKLLYEEIYKKSLYAVGELWEYNKISVATEHLASAIVESLLNKLYYRNLAHVTPRKKTVIVSCVQNEFHQIGLKMISDVFEINGWNSHFLGANTPTTELIHYAKLINPDLIAVSLSIYFNLPNLISMVHDIRNNFPELPILVGGQAFRHVGTDAFSAVDLIHYYPDLMSTESYIQQFNT